MDNRKPDWTKEEFLDRAKNMLSGLNGYFRRLEENDTSAQYRRFDPILSDLLDKNDLCLKEIVSYLDNKLKDVK